MIDKATLNYNKNYYWLIAVALLLGAVGSRFAFLGYPTLYHGEAEAGQEIAYFLPCLKELTFLEAMWRLWHLFPINFNPMVTLLPIRVPIAWFFGISEFNLRLHSAMGGVISCMLVFWLVRRHSDRKTALIALSLVVFNPFIIAFNRFTFQESIQITFMLTGLLFVDFHAERRKIGFLLLSSFCFALSFLIKPNAVIFIALILFLYLLFFKMRVVDIAIVVAGIMGIIICLFIDQLPMFFSSFLNTSSWVSTGMERSSAFQTMLFYIKTYIYYFEHVIFPLLVCAVLFKKIENKFFRILLLFSILYFSILFFQGRTFFRYLQVGIIMVSAAFAYPLSKYTEKKYSYAGMIFLTIYITWGLFSHGHYISSQYHHIPYKYIRERVYQLSGSGDILLYGRNSETEYYLSPNNNLVFDETLNPCEETVLLRSEFPEWADKARKIPDSLSQLFVSGAVNSGDILVVTGMQMSFGEPTPLSLGIRKWGMRFWGIREYGHLLSHVNEFYEKYNNNTLIRQKYELLEKVFLTNNSDKLAALILRKN